MDNHKCCYRIKILYCGLNTPQTTFGKFLVVIFRPGGSLGGHQKAAAGAGIVLAVVRSPKTVADLVGKCEVGSAQLRVAFVGDEAGVGAQLGGVSVDQASVPVRITEGACVGHPCHHTWDR